MGRGAYFVLRGRGRCAKHRRRPDRLSKWLRVQPSAVHRAHSLLVAVFFGSSMVSVPFCCMARKGALCTYTISNEKKTVTLVGLLRLSRNATVVAFFRYCTAPAALTLSWPCR